jgi:hypothetical protein
MFQQDGFPATAAANYRNHLPSTHSQIDAPEHHLIAK